MIEGDPCSSADLDLPATPHAGAGQARYRLGKSAPTDLVDALPDPPSSVRRCGRRSAERRQVAALDLTGGGTCAGPDHGQSLVVTEAIPAR
jgi:hypothetical protein